MRTGNPPMGAIETAMLNLAAVQVGKSLGLPTHGYLVASDAKVADAQAGMESGISAVLGALAGINMISGAGMLDFLACQSAEKLVMDAEVIASAQRLLQGVEGRTPTLAVETFAQAGLSGDFLKLEETRKLFRSEQHLPSEVTDRESLRAWQESGAPDTFTRARKRVAELVAGYTRPALANEVERELLRLVEGRARAARLERLPGI
jgi:trimethylamine--corrinoid protein Co-methyltransferase